MEGYLVKQPDGTALLSMETIVNMPTSMTLLIAGVEWEVIGWEAYLEAIRLKPRIVSYRYVTQWRTEDGMQNIEWQASSGSRGAKVVRRVSFAKFSELESNHEPDSDREYTVYEIDELTRE